MATDVAIVADTNDKSNKTDDQEETVLQKYWRAVRENPGDFTGWTYLLQFVEQENDIDAAREAFDAFLSHYPYCYGYWKKFADLEKKQKNTLKAIEVFERGLKAIPLSVELWQHYITYYSDHVETDSDAETKIRELYEKAVAAAGLDFRADRLWDSYITWEKKQSDLVKVTTLYDRLLHIPMQLYGHHFDCFKRFAEAHHPKVILPLDEFLKYRLEVVSETKLVNDDDATEAPPGVETAQEEEAPPGETPPGEDPPPGLDAVPPGVEGGGGESDAGEATLLREKIIASKQTIFQQTEEEVRKRWNYEEGIKRPYFHVKPLERTQLKNWRDYLDFEIENGSHDHIVVLFERCMVACALYEDLWLKYAMYMEQHDVDAVKNIFKRACNIHLPKKANIHMAWAAFEEKQGCHSEASQILRNFESHLPGCMMLSLRRINLERRMSMGIEVEVLYEEYMTSATTPEAKDFFAIKYARYLSKVASEPEKARGVLREAVKRNKSNPRLYLQLLDLEYLGTPIHEERVLDIFKQVLASDMPMETKFKFSQRQLEYLEDFGIDVSRLLKSYDDHQKLLKDITTERKRKLEVAEEAEQAEKRQKIEVNTSTTGASHNGAESQHYPMPPAIPTDTHAYSSYPTSQWDNNYASYGYQGQGRWGGGYGQHY